MEEHALLVIADPADPRLAMLDSLSGAAAITVGAAPEDFARAAAEARAILKWDHGNRTLREIFGQCPRLEWVHTRAAGIDSLLFPELVESAVTLTNGTGVYSDSLGEFAMAAILYFAKDLRRMIRNQQAEAWAPFDVEEIAGRTVGIVGYGDIGRAVAARARAMGMRVLAVKRRPAAESDEFAERIYASERRAEMMALSDYVVASAPLTDKTRGMIGEAEFAAMRPGAVMINVGRGLVIHEAALLAALVERRIKGAALDVFETEPLPAGHPFYRMENVLLSPHCADHTADWETNAMRFFIEQFERFRKGEPLRNVVDKRRGY
jgi:phosphoglycerate dehydrogenase-like enzyme